MIFRLGYSSIRRRASLVDHVVCTSRPRFLSGVVPSPPVLDPQPCGTAATYLEALYTDWAQDPSAVTPEWQAYFSTLGSSSTNKQNLPPAARSANVNTAASFSRTSGPQSVATDPLIAEHLKVQLLVRAYQVRGHLLATLDPLGIRTAALPALAASALHDAPELDLAYYGFSKDDLARRFELGPGMLPGYRVLSPTLTLAEIVSKLKESYCGSIGIEYMHIMDRKQCDWLRARIEVPNRIRLSEKEKRALLDRLFWSDSFERFVAQKFPSEKRFGLEGCEALIPGMKALIDRAVENGVEHVVMGMPHRGRLNVLTNVVRKPSESIFCEFSGSAEPNLLQGSGDVKYHLGMSYDRPTPSGRRVHLSLVANPSHLEAVDPVVLGKTRALQFYLAATSSSPESARVRAMPILLHGDAAFAGQGVVYETLGFADLPSYTVGGTIHIIVNNQVGFTTDPRLSRSTPYCSDIAKSVAAPIIHVNADDAEAVVFACRLAADWRHEFARDVVVDLVCYRRHGHNEVDQPAFTQPRMYKKIAEQEPVLDKYIAKLLGESTVSAEDVKANRELVWNSLSECYERSKSHTPTPQEWVSSSWHGMRSPRDLASEAVPARDTGCPISILERVGKVISSGPDLEKYPGFVVHPLLQRVLRSRATALASVTPEIDMSTAEGLAIGSLLLENRTHVRLSGQDVERGTFSQRHAVLYDQNTEAQYTPLNELLLLAKSGLTVAGGVMSGGPALLEPMVANPSETSSSAAAFDSVAHFTVSNSSLSEFGVLGFELGYSLAHPNSLVIWEAQFGDFSNNAQCIIDQFIASGEQKWLQRSGLVLNLPHGFDGQGPEHSSARIERFLELADEQPYVFPSPEAQARQHQDCNIQVVYPTTAGNYFHALRRQIMRDFRKPLVMATSKSLLRHPMARSKLADMASGTRFARFIPDVDSELFGGQQKQDAAEVTRAVLCTGQVYYALARARALNQCRHVALGRIEQLNPFPFDCLLEFLQRYPNANVIWAQEEPLNMGAWNFVDPRLRTVLRQLAIVSGRGIGAAVSRVEEGTTAQGQSFSDPVLYAGRGPSGAVATGNKKLHVLEERALISEALFGKQMPVIKVENGVPLYNVC